MHIHIKKKGIKKMKFTDSHKKCENYRITRRHSTDKISKFHIPMFLFH